MAWNWKVDDDKIWLFSIQSFYDGGNYREQDVKINEDLSDPLCLKDIYQTR